MIKAYRTENSYNLWYNWRFSNQSKPMQVQLSSAAKRANIFIIAIAILMELLDATILNTSLPQIARSLHSNPISLKVVITTYLLTLGVFIPVSGWLVDRIGERKSLLIAICIFLLSSIGCGLSVNLPMLTVFRLFQGMGGAFLAPVARLVLLRVYGRNNTVHAMARISTFTILGLALGPILGGAITTYLGWRWIFFINVPFGLIGMFLIYRYLPNLSERHIRPFDFIGFILIGGALGLGLFFLDVVVQPIFSITEKISVLFIALLFALAYMWHTKKAKHLLLDFSVFKNRTFKLTAFGSLTSRAAFSTAPFLIPLMLQASYGFNALHAGLFMVPSSLGALSSRLFIAKWISVYSHRKLLIYNTCAMAVIYFSFAINAFYFSPILLIIQQLLFGFGMGLQFTGMNSLAYKNLNEDQINRGTSIYSAVIQLSASFGIAVAALIMILVIGTDNLSHHIPLIAFKVVFMVQGLFLLISLLLFYKLKPTQQPDLKTYQYPANEKP